MSRITNRNLAMLATTAFANAAAATAPAAGNTTGKRPGAPKAEDRVTPAFTNIRKDIPVPAGARRGSKSVYTEQFESLTEVGMSFGLTNKTKAQISSAVSKANGAKDNQRPKLNADGTPAMKAGTEIKDQNGVVVGHGPATQEFERIKEFVAYDVDPKSDPDKATVRIFRIK